MIGVFCWLRPGLLRDNGVIAAILEGSASAGTDS